MKVMSHTQIKLSKKLNDINIFSMLHGTKIHFTTF